MSDLITDRDQPSLGPDSDPNFTPPTYTIKNIYDAIPAHCFRPSTLLSLFYILRDFSFVATLLLLATQISNLPDYPYLKTASWTLYTFLQGLIFTGLWELAHECGHGALSKSKRFNYTAGLIIHSLLLVPFHSWRFTHSHHHKSTNNLDRDIAFVPMKKEQFMKEKEEKGEWMEYMEDMPIIAFLHLLIHQVLAWPIYLLINNFAIPRIAEAEWWKRSHFYLGGDGPNFKPENRKDILVSDVGLAFAIAGLCAAVRVWGAANVAVFYGVPWLWTNHWILTITFLQHTSTQIPYYPTSTWTFLRGAASTVDRDFGFIGRVLFHGAIETHVVHHHSSRIPFYHAIEASRAIREVMGSHYKSDFKTPYLWSFWRNYRDCKFVVETREGSGIWFFAKDE